MAKKKINKPKSINIPDYQMESLAKVLLPIMQDYLSSEQGQKDFAEWKQLQLNNKNVNIKSDCIHKDNVDKK